MEKMFTPWRKCLHHKENFTLWCKPFLNGLHRGEKCLRNVYTVEKMFTPWRKCLHRGEKCLHRKKSLNLHRRETFSTTETVLRKCLPHGKKGFHDFSLRFLICSKLQEKSINQRVVLKGHHRKLINSKYSRLDTLPL
ncbi:hypothetical protein SNE40_000160 [Patella caerulea]|uniref:Uncharacterized protein n=1 Tax=Patella caerulea TaxID=87958 RepID=A0AAN8KDU7_PATCE